MLLLFVAGLCALLGKGEQGQQTLVLTGSSTVAPLMVEIGKRF